MSGVCVKHDRYVQPDEVCPYCEPARLVHAGLDGSPCLCAQCWKPVPAIPWPREMQPAPALPFAPIHIPLIIAALAPPIHIPVMIAGLVPKVESTIIPFSPEPIE